MIATPAGGRAVSSLQEGDLVWTADAAGLRVAAHVTRVASIPADPGQRVLLLWLADGRLVTGSEGHPIADGRPLATLTPGESIDGAPIFVIDDAPLTGGATWDLLPEGPTGLYWADGVLLGSTLH